MSRVKSTRTVGRPDRMETELLEERVRAEVARSQSDAEAARALGVSDTTVYRVPKRLGLPSGWGR